MKATLTLSEAELLKIIRESLAKRGVDVDSVSFSVSAGDSPWDMSYTTATVTVDLGSDE